MGKSLFYVVGYVQKQKIFQANRFNWIEMGVENLESNKINNNKNFYFLQCIFMIGFQAKLPDYFSAVRSKFGLNKFLFTQLKLHES